MESIKADITSASRLKVNNETKYYSRMEEKKFGKITNEINRTGMPVTVYKNNKPWVVMYPAVTQEITNVETLEALAKADRMVEERSGQKYTPVEDFFDALHKAVEDA